MRAHSNHHHFYFFFLLEKPKLPPRRRRWKEEENCCWKMWSGGGGRRAQILFDLYHSSLLCHAMPCAIAIQYNLNNNAPIKGYTQGAVFSFFLSFLFSSCCCLNFVVYLRTQTARRLDLMRMPRFFLYCTFLLLLLLPPAAVRRL